MGRARQTFERRQLGLTLRRLREEAGLTQQAAADGIGRVRSRIVELEEGKGTLSQEDLNKLLDCYRVPEAERPGVLTLGAEARKRQRVKPRTHQLPDSYLLFADFEASATEIRNYEPGMVPGLLQSPNYVRAIIGHSDDVWWESSPAEVEERVTFRLDRQTRTWASRHPQVLHFIMGEEAVRATVDSPQVMREQVTHILTLLSEHDSLTVQILPSACRRNPARGGAFALFDFASADASAVGVSTVVYGPDTYFDETSDTEAMRRAFKVLERLALSPKESARLLEVLSHQENQELS
jgi:transcriptional regulator with XRE-family HTH domain